MQKNGKIEHMRIAAAICGYNLEHKGMDLLVSLYELISEKGDRADLNSIVKIQMDVEKRERGRLVVKLEQEEQIHVLTKRKRTSKK